MATGPLPTTLLEDRMADWWRPLAVDLDGRIVGRRVDGVRALREGLSARNAVAAVAYAYGDEESGAAIIDLIRDAARHADPAYGGQVGDAEPPALAAAALADQLAVHPDSDLSTLIAALVLSAAFSGRVPAIPGMRLSEYAECQLVHRSASARATPPLRERPSAGELVRETLAAIDRNDAPSWEDDRREAALPAHAELLAALAARIDELAANAEREHAVLREQLRQHTWVMESWCETAGATWRDVEPAARPMIAAIELAERTWGIAPAVDAEALLASILADADPGPGVDVARAVAAAGPFLNGHLSVAPHPDLFPLATALVGWRSDHAAAFDMWSDPDHGHGAVWHEQVPLAMQAYREALALRALSHG